MGGGGGGMLPDFFLCSLFPDQQTTSGIGYRVEYFFRVGNQNAEYEKQQPLIPPKRFGIFSPITGGCSEGLGAL